MEDIRLIHIGGLLAQAQKQGKYFDHIYQEEVSKLESELRLKYRTKLVKEKLTEQEAQNSLYNEYRDKLYHLKNDYFVRRRKLEHSKSEEFFKNRNLEREKQQKQFRNSRNSLYEQKEKMRQVLKEQHIRCEHILRNFERRYSDDYWLKNDPLKVSISKKEVQNLEEPIKSRALFIIENAENQMKRKACLMKSGQMYESYIDQKCNNYNKIKKQMEESLQRTYKLQEQKRQLIRCQAHDDEQALRANLARNRQKENERISKKIIFFLI